MPTYHSSHPGPLVKTMIMIPNCRLVRKQGRTDIFCFLIEGNPHVLRCPVCGQQTLRLRDHRLRIMRVLGGETYWVDAPRYCCTNEHPHRYHIGLPECLVHFKHYQAQLIQDAADELLTKEDLDQQEIDYPCAQTIERWKEWVERNRQKHRWIPEIHRKPASWFREKTPEYRRVIARKVKR